MILSEYFTNFNHLDLDRLDLKKEIMEITQEPNLYQLSVNERREDLLELAWLISECENKLVEMDKYVLNYDFIKKLKDMYNKILYQLQQICIGYMEKTETCTLENYLELKYKIRLVLKQISGIVSSGDWQSPAISYNNVKEHGFIQKERDQYARTSGSLFVKEYEKEFFKEIYHLDRLNPNKCKPYLTNSGMNALEMGLLAFKAITKEKLPVYYQSNYYYEGVTLAQSMFPKAQPLTVPHIYEKLDKNETIGCLLVDPEQHSLLVMESI